MSEISEGIQSFYQKFVLRDVLSFVTPGAIVVITFYYCLDFQLDLKFVKNIIWMFSLILFGFFYIIGFVCQSISWVICMSYYRKDKMKDFYSIQRDMLKINMEGRGEILQQHERFVVLKQLCSNNSVALYISALTILISGVCSKTPYLKNMLFPVGVLFVLTGFSSSQ